MLPCVCSESKDDIKMWWKQRSGTIKPQASGLLMIFTIWLHVRRFVSFRHFLSLKRYFPSVRLLSFFILLILFSFFQTLFNAFPYLKQDSRENIKKKKKKFEIYLHRDAFGKIVNTI